MAGLIIRTLGIDVDYRQCMARMRRYTLGRDENVCDEVWVLQHKPVFTRGTRNTNEAVLLYGSAHSDIPVVSSDRGGLTTYHGPGQIVIYLLLDLRRRGIGIKKLVEGLEQAVICFLAEHNIEAGRKPGSPGVYTNSGAKISALGLRIRNGCCYHGLSLNVNMDISPFSSIDPCGMPGLSVTQIVDFGVKVSPEQAAAGVLQSLTRGVLGRAPS